MPYHLSKIDSKHAHLACFAFSGGFAGSCMAVWWPQSLLNAVTKAFDFCVYDSILRWGELAGKLSRTGCTKVLLLLQIFWFSDSNRPCRIGNIKILFSLPHPDHLIKSHLRLIIAISKQFNLPFSSGLQLNFLPELEDSSKMLRSIPLFIKCLLHVFSYLSPLFPFISVGHK